MVGLSMPLTGMMTSLEGLWHLRKRDTICQQAEVHPVWHQQMLEIISLGSSSQIFSMLAGGEPSHWHCCGIQEGHAWPLRMGSLSLIWLYTWIHSYSSVKRCLSCLDPMSKWPFILATCVSRCPPHGPFYCTFIFSLENKCLKCCCLLLHCLCLPAFILSINT